MNLRDYMAVHSTQPGMSEIVAVAGYSLRSTQVITKEGDNLGTFNMWWETLTRTERLDLASRVRYAQADSMRRVGKEAM